MTQAARTYWLKPGGWADTAGLSIAGLCLVHCLSTALLFAALSSLGGIFASHWVHEGGLVLAILFGALALGRGVVVHGYVMPAAVGALGLGMMAGALALPHGGTEILYTVIGVAVLALGHDLNRRAVA